MDYLLYFMIPCILLVLIVFLIVAIVLLPRRRRDTSNQLPDDYSVLYRELGFDKNGYNKYGYNIHGRNAKNQYNRLYDIASFRTGAYNPDGFLNPHMFPVAVTDHAFDRFEERLDVSTEKALKYAQQAYQFGRSARQIKKTSAAMIYDIEQRHAHEENSDPKIVLIYKNYIYLFTEKNVLITVYKNERIPL